MFQWLFFTPFIGIPEFLDFGLKCWRLDSECWTLDDRPWTLNSGRWALDSGRWTLKAGLRMLDSGCWALDAVLWMLDSVSWTLDKSFPFCFTSHLFCRMYVLTWLVLEFLNERYMLHYKRAPHQLKKVL